ncbi:MAG: sulfatase family protein [bacterium]
MPPSRIVGLVTMLLALGAASCDDPAPPNVILCLSDDQGFGDAGYQGHARLRTPHLDALARRGVRLDRFYVSPMCTPTRAGLLTGRNPARYGIVTTGLESLTDAETTIAEILAARGWATGHFGKWHLGTFGDSVTTFGPRVRRGDDPDAPPWENGFETCFSTESSVPTWDPSVDPESGGAAAGRYWEGAGRPSTENLSGDDSRAILDRVEAFVRSAVAEKRPFLAAVWFHTPHRPVLAGPDWLRAYADRTQDEANYWGALSAMDAQLGRLLRLLDELGIRDETFLFFASDNGPALNENRWVSAGSPGPFRGGKGSLLEGGVRVPAIVDWPARLGRGTLAEPTSFLDVLPTVLAAAKVDLPAEVPPLDGIDLLPALDGTVAELSRPIALRTRRDAALVEGRYKILSERDESTVALYDVLADPQETCDLAGERPELFEELRAKLDDQLTSFTRSQIGQAGDAQR